MAEYTTQNFSYTKAFLNSILDAYSTRPAAALAATVTVGLFTSPSAVPSPNSVLTDFSASAPTFTGYAALTPTLTSDLNVTPGIQGCLGSGTYSCTLDADPNACTAYGYYVYSGSDLVGAELFPDDSRPNFNNAGDFLALDVILPQVSEIVIA